jgi:hypothetical protein
VNPAKNITFSKFRLLFADDYGKILEKGAVLCFITI